MPGARGGRLQLLFKSPVRYSDRDLQAAVDEELVHHAGRTVAGLRTQASRLAPPEIVEGADTNAFLREQLDGFVDALEERIRR